MPKKKSKQLELIPETLVNKYNVYDSLALSRALSEKAELESRLVMIDDFIETLHQRIIKYVA